MVALTAEVAVQLLGRQCLTDVETIGTLLVSLRRSRAKEAISDELYDDLNAVLDPYPLPAVDETKRIAGRLWDEAGKVLAAVPYLATPYPVDEVRDLVDLRARWPYPGSMHSYVVHLALAVLAVLDAMGEVAP